MSTRKLNEYFVAVNKDKQIKDLDLLKNMEKSEKRFDIQKMCGRFVI